MLGPLQDNGGPTLTHALLPGSPAINTGDPNFTPPPIYDQRGSPFVRVFNGRIDIGSFEVQPPRRLSPFRGRPNATPTSIGLVYEKETEPLWAVRARDSERRQMADQRTMPDSHVYTDSHACGHTNVIATATPTVTVTPSTTATPTPTPNLYSKTYTYTKV